MPRARSRTSSPARRTTASRRWTVTSASTIASGTAGFEGLTPEQTAHALACSLGLVQEYLAIDDLLRRTGLDTRPGSPDNETWQARG